MTPEAIAILLTVATAVLAPALIAWGDVRRQVKAGYASINDRIDVMVKEWQDERDFTRDWMKTIAEQIGENTKEIAFLMGKGARNGK